MILGSIVTLTRAIEAPPLTRIRTDPRTKCMADITQHQYGGDLEGAEKITLKCFAPGSIILCAGGSPNFPQHSSVDLAFVKP